VRVARWASPLVLGRMRSEESRSPRDRRGAPDTIEEASEAVDHVAAAGSGPLFFLTTYRCLDLIGNEPRDCFARLGDRIWYLARSAFLFLFVCLFKPGRIESSTWLDLVLGSDLGEPPRGKRADR
jgi:hypothetical protein